MCLPRELLRPRRSPTLRTKTRATSSAIRWHSTRKICIRSHFQPQPKRNLKPYRGEIVGLNTGPGTLPFPTREETILPANFETNSKVSVRETGKNLFELRYQGADATVVYEFRPRAGNLSELTVSVNGRAAFRPLDGGGIRFAGHACGKRLRRAVGVGQPGRR